MKRTLILDIMLLLCCVLPVNAVTRLVPSQYQTIQAAIDDCNNGDIIIVAEGRYYENIEFSGKNIVLTSANPDDPCVVAATIIDGNNLESVVTFAGTENKTCVLSGFTIQNGYHDNEYTRGGGGICGGTEINHTCATIHNNIITHNFAWDGGGLSRCDGLIEKNIISYNYARWWQGGGGLYQCNGIIRNNIIAGNDAGGCESAGGLSFCDAAIENNTIAQNFSNGVGVVAYGQGTIRNCIIWGNSPQGIWNSMPFFSCIQGWTGGGIGNIDVEPCFTDPNNGDYHLLLCSPCINAGDPDYQPEPDETDLDGRPRVIGGRIDMGAYEFPATHILYVDEDATGANNGLSWQNAYKFLQDALMMARYGDEIRVAQGIYKPDQFALSDRPCLGRAETFQLKNGVIIRGGYAGFGQPDPNVRDIRLYETILSGDLDSNDIEIEDIKSSDFIYSFSRSENSYTVVTGSGTDSTAVLDGFTITGGNSNGQYGAEGNGGGMYNHRGNPTVVNCIFRRNSARGLESYFPYRGAGGGGVFNLQSSPTFQSCQFEENLAFGADEFSCGGGMYDVNSQPTMIGCTFAGNVAYGYDSEYYGGAIFDYNSSAVLTDCSFIDNWAHSGGAMFSSYNSSATLTRCLLAGNYAYHGGGAILCSSAHLNLANCTFAGNRAPYSATIDGEHWEKTNYLKAVNSIFWDGGDEVSTRLSEVKITFSDIQGGWEGQGNIDVDPCFAQVGDWDANGTPDTDHDDFWVDGDYHLKSQAGRWKPSENPKSEFRNPKLAEGSWVKDEVTSLCIDAGDTASPIGLEPFPNGGIINMGAYGGTVEASKSYFGEPVCENIVAGDINGDCKIDYQDLFFLSLNWLADNRQK